ncbi:hypothetical protein [Xylophilus sp. GOD-11R]|uniref:hypothetical protein n=1 Tax=Xylophilus sp. GOD-11R TaxID=3089814 RepID=UPI00298C4FBC|nr:hypothetical protein [Xylophilus sp. GOD-11R]WPB55337.1 hypothetical protein R9X41_14415 [Xylophilus sp. GOD-11R]
MKLKYLSTLLISAATIPVAHGAYVDLSTFGYESNNGSASAEANMLVLTEVSPILPDAPFLAM